VDGGCVHVGHPGRMYYRQCLNAVSEPLESSSQAERHIEALPECSDAILATRSLQEGVNVVADITRDETIEHTTESESVDVVAPSIEAGNGGLVVPVQLSPGTFLASPPTTLNVNFPFSLPDTVGGKPSVSSLLTETRTKSRKESRDVLEDKETYSDKNPLPQRDSGKTILSTVIAVVA
jgi:hypothetical protein